MAYKTGNLVVNKSNDELAMTIHGFLKFRDDVKSNLLETPTKWVVCKYLDGKKWIEEVFHEDELELLEDDGL
jgi:uncharacterized protein YodC (DUF2158 family)